jgi:hypothetical protein
VYTFEAVPGDLVAPKVTARFASKLRIAKIKKSISVRLTSNEVAVGTASLVVAKQLPSKARPKRKAGKKTFTFAASQVSLQPGSKTVKLKISKAGLKALKQLRGVGKSMSAVTATLKLTFTDQSGNTANATRTLKLVAK